MKEVRREEEERLGRRVRDTAHGEILATMAQTSSPRQASQMEEAGG